MSFKRQLNGQNSEEVDPVQHRDMGDDEGRYQHQYQADKDDKRPVDHEKDRREHLMWT